MIVEFFRELFRSRVRMVEARTRGKTMGVESRAKSKVANKFNAVVDKPLDRASALADKKQRAALKARAKADKGKKKAAGGGGGGGGGGGRSGGGAQGGGRGGAGNKAGGASEKRGVMGLFRSKSSDGGRGAAAAGGESFGDDGATQVIDVSSFQDDRSFDVVGWLVPLNGVDRGRDFRLHSGKNIIGTAADCDIVITDPYMSSKHAAVVHQNGIFTLIDLGSTNGTCLNDRAAQKEELIDNDTVRVGRTELKFKSLF